MHFTKHNIHVCFTRACLVFMLFGANEISAQGIKAGSVSLLTKGTFNSYKSEWPVSKSISYIYSTSLHANYFVAENLSVGIGYLYRGYRETGEYISPVDGIYSIDRKEDFHSAFVQVRKYWFFNNHIAFFVLADYGYGEESSASTGPDLHRRLPTYDYRQHLVQLAPGLAVFAHPRFAIELNLGVAEFLSREYQYENSSNKVKLNRFDANLIPNLNIGFQYFLSKR